MYAFDSPTASVDPTGLRGFGGERVGKGNDCDWEKIRRLIADGRTTKEIEKELIKNGKDRNKAKAMVKACEKEWNKRNAAKRGVKKPKKAKGDSDAMDSATSCIMQDPIECMEILKESGGYSPPGDPIGDAGRDMRGWWRRLWDKIIFWQVITVTRLVCSHALG